MSPKGWQDNAPGTRKFSTDGIETPESVIESLIHNAKKNSWG